MAESKAEAIRPRPAVVGRTPRRDAGQAGAASRTRRYASPLIAERRARILGEAKTLIGEVGAERFTVRELGQRAGVSVTTIYNIFGGKEAVIAHALREFHAGIRLALPPAASRLAGFLQAISDTTAIVVENRAYALALADLYSSRSLAPMLLDVIRSMPLQIFSHWLWSAEKAGLLLDGCDPGFAENSFANLEWATIRDWGAGRISDDLLESARHRSFLLVVIASAKDPVRRAAEAMLAERR